MRPTPRAAARRLLLGLAAFALGCSADTDGKRDADASVDGSGSIDSAVAPDAPDAAAADANDAHDAKPEDAFVEAFPDVDARDAIAIDPWDPLPTFEESRIVSGPYAGGYLVAPAGYLNWYFANLGLVAFVDRVPAEVKAYLALYIAHLRPDFSIEDVSFSNPYDPGAGTSATRAQDSDDSYAATFLSLAARYVHVTKDRAWLDANRATLEAIADRNLIASQESNGLVHVFQSLAKYPFAYTEDNCEAWHGLHDLAQLLTEIGDPAASRYQGAADAIAIGISKTMFLPADRAFAVIYGTTVAPLGSTFYPDAVTQVFPRAHGLPVTAAEDDGAWAFLSKRAPSWWNGSYDKAPFMILGYAAALRGDATAALAQQAHLRDLVKTDRGSAAIHELGYYQRINDFHRTGISY